jgi:hypothetical protein
MSRVAATVAATLAATLAVTLAVTVADRWRIGGDVWRPRTLRRRTAQAGTANQ